MIDHGSVIRRGAKGADRDSGRTFFVGVYRRVAVEPIYSVVPTVTR